MRRTLLISSDPLFALQLAARWQAGEDTVSAVLLDAAAAVARAAHPDAAAITEALQTGVAVAVHDDALRRRAVASGAVVDGVKVVDLDEVADLVGDGSDWAVWL